MRRTPLKDRHPELVAGSIVPPVRSNRRQTQPHRKVMPIRVVTVDKIDLPRSVPVFELLFARDCGDHGPVDFEVNQPVDGVTFGETRLSALAMLPHPAEQIRGHAAVERAVILARKNIHAWDPLLPHGPECAAKWTLKQVQGDGIGLSLEFFPKSAPICRPARVFAPSPTHLRHAELVSASTCLTRRTNDR